MSIKELSKEMDTALCDLVQCFADDYLDGKPAVLASAIYYSVQKLLLDKANEINEKFK